MKRLFSGLFVATGTASLAANVLSGVENLLSPSRIRRSRSLESIEPAAVEAAAPTMPEPVAEVSVAPEAPADRNFSIKRTKSEVGYVYWILEGFGKYKCFVLCDSWDEAVAQAKARLAEVDGADMNEPIVSQTVA